MCAHLLIITKQCYTNINICKTYTKREITKDGGKDIKQLKF